MLAPAGRSFDGADQRTPLREALQKHGQMHPGQTAGRLLPMACVSLEITQRCNLDCSLCYLSDRAEAAKDVPLSILFERIEMVHSHYGAGTSIQISGGDPTLRSVDDLEAICRHIRALGMRSCLMTNGIKATRKMLSRLAKAGLDDLALHVDLTQERKGYATETALHAVRSDYIERAKGLGLRILFNTTVFDGNIHELPALARFFRQNADKIDFISFQMQADTGRGVLRDRANVITQASVMAALRKGMGIPLDFDAAAVGHGDCNRYTSMLSAGDEALCPLTNKPLVTDAISALDRINARDKGNLDFLSLFARLALRNPLLAGRMVAEAARWLWRLRRGLIQGRGRMHRMGILVHNFMDATKLDHARCESCVFMVMTADGPLSMCVHNAERDTHIFAPTPIKTADGPRWWNAETGITPEKPANTTLPLSAPLPFKHLKGRQRAEAAAIRATARQSR